MGAKKRSTTPAPKAGTKINNLGSGSGGVCVNTSTAKDGNGLRGMSESVLRAGFLKKVYGLLAAQLTFTAMTASLCMFTPAIRDTFLKLAGSHSWWLQLAFLIPSCLSLLVLKLGVKDKYPANYFFLFLFTVGISIQICYVCSVYVALGHAHLILQAFGVTAVIFLGLSAYVLYSGKDFSYLGGFLRMSLWGLVVVGMGALFFPWMVQGLLYGFVGALTFCGYILYDTWRIQKQFGYDDYIGATIEIYLDIVNLFLYVLDILTKMDKKQGDKKKKDK